ncbi:Serine/threonine-protein kinase RIO1 [Sciurus carolinensis]|uniref:non-specific serine/threonine protein kinase n=1 Tax=Sciurus carolinensis TaxID=30640 RepID=A0AA41N927_SCICA|nr:Serine/threonine-protein kinase RIO1 [Sciurus carolinensis]
MPKHVISSDNVDLKIIKAEDGILFEDLQNNVTEKSESEIKVEEEEEEDYDDDSDWDWDDGVGKLTKGYVWNGGSNPQANRQISNYSSARMSTPADKVLRKFENKINLDKLNVTDSVINKVTEKSRQQEADMLNTAEIPCPEPIMLRSHVLVMGFIGKDDMYHGGGVYIIDVSQSVEHDHPHALEFLRKDCANVSDFFLKHAVAVMTVRELFEFITDPSITPENMDAYLSKVIRVASQRTKEERSNQDHVDEEVFKRAYIPRTLNEVKNYERDVDMMMKLKEEDMAMNAQQDNVPALLENKVKEKICSDSEDVGSSECSDEDSEEQGDHVHCKKHTTDPDIDKKVGQEL